MTDIKILKEREEHINQMIYRVFSSQHKTDTNSADTDQIDESVNNILHIFLLIKFRQKDKNTRQKVIWRMVKEKRQKMKVHKKENKQ